jgi:hypothetical protein
MADTLRQAAGEMITTLMGWWTTTPSTGVDTTVVHTAQRFVTSWLALPIAVIALMAVVGWGVASGSDQWIRDAVRGLLVFGIVATAAIPIVSALQAWSESLARGLLGAVPAKDVGARFQAMLDMPGSSPGIVIFFAALMFLVGVVQYLLMLFRDGAVVLLTVVIPVAAAGQFSRGSLLWLPKVSGWLLAFVFMKPGAALIYYVGLSLLGQATGVQAIATAICLMATAVLALPALLRLVTFAVEAAPVHTNVMATAATAAGVAASGAQLMTRRPQSAAPVEAAAVASTGPAGAAFAAVDAASNLPNVAANAVDPSASRTSGGNP